MAVVSKLPIPDLMLESIYELSPGYLKERGIKILLMDLDNTLSPYGEHRPTVALRNWLDAMKRAGIEPFILSNNRGDRPKNFAGALSLDYSGHSGKPSIRGLNAVLERKGLSREQAAIIGDQIYTDILCGRRAGVYTIAVRPIDMRNPFRAIRYGLEYPFRYAYRRRAKIFENSKEN